MNDKWINNLQDLYTGEERQAPEGLLDSIKTEMLRRGVMPASEEKKARIVPLIYWKRIASAAALVAIIAGATVLAYRMRVFEEKTDNTLTDNNSETLTKNSGSNTKNNSNYSDAASQSQTLADEEQPQQQDMAPEADADKYSSYSTTAHDNSSNISNAPVAYSSSSKANNSKGKAGNDTNVNSALDSHSSSTSHKADKASNKNVDTQAKNLVKQNDMLIAETDKKANNITVEDYASHKSDKDNDKAINKQDADKANADMLIAENANVQDVNEQKAQMTEVSKEAEAENYTEIQGIQDINAKIKKDNIQLGIYYTYLSGKKQCVYANNVNAADGSSTTMTTNEDHKRPFKLGFSFKYNIDKRWALLTGLTYTSMDSHLTTVNGQNSVSKNQKLIYFGLPLNISYSFWRNSKLNIYATGGFEAAKSLMGTVTDPKIMFSTNASLGIEYKVNKQTYIFAEPGYVYYFDNSSELHSAFTEHPNNFSLSVGLRFDLKK
ncbi:MAG: outer membrane beta-barrel protein [Bacteroidaceae bacterium]|nr:outer membrane beta-barrel protein [Bacteroidaceae bacterium]